jgi:hypothetical protein
VRQLTFSAARNTPDGRTAKSNSGVLHLRRHTDRIIKEFDTQVTELSAAQWDRLDPLQRVERLLAAGFLASSCEWLAVRSWQALPLIVRIRLGD